ncbi:MAG: UDP-N-acetylmuramoyl-L-alanine--D-glutamate ligase [Hamadaea sp.]|uniref:UDP-N-acetylmuramoyl-L-alanine--D-glutamate ligase n=1 Tax=Hamadaea sp. TaxID=2024425 RepID=UPI0017C5449D|nr:UDP-N-acetylmuramoyl-L-alanine--D-glutamate ligase [Hamadaea sp.]NUR72656.1 UDP-N-acetylmuramoyl-L-alanine--D-glutamate ligase [Hamadaea sp.]NUT21661.1 UDP-N-acetylmuramoyl-L-alanine--D-glutamate ligase [Hamadaea sp.]
MSSVYEGRRVLVVGTGTAGAASARALLKAGAQVTVTDQKATDALAALRDLGAVVSVGAGSGSSVGDLGLLSGISDLVVSPGVPPYHPLAAAAVAGGIDVYSEPELAWRLRGPGAPPWLALTGTNGKTTTVTMLAAILRAAGHQTGAFGNIGVPLVEVPDGLDVLAVELSSFQLHWSSQLAPEAGAILNLADDHLEWHGDFAAYAGAKEAIWRSARAGTGTAVGNADDPRVFAALTRAGGKSPVAFTLGAPAPDRFGVTDGRLTTPDGQPIIEADRIKPAGTHNVANALAAAALAVAYGVAVEAIRDGLAGYVPEPHRNAYVTTVAGVDYVDDSKATNPHAALASLTAYPRIVWVAGGQLKGVDVDELVQTVASRLAGAVLLGVDREQIAAALARHAPELPVVQVARTDDGAMGEVVAAAARLAQPGDTVLLAPAAASKDMFHGYDHRGSAYAAAVRALATDVRDG